MTASYLLPPLHIALEGCNRVGRDRLALWGTKRLKRSAALFSFGSKPGCPAARNGFHPVDDVAVLSNEADNILFFVRGEYRKWSRARNHGLVSGRRLLIGI